MTWLAEWLKEIIFVVLLAAFIDLLLPNRSMERYVKLVISLLILLTLIAPVMRLFAPDAERQLEMAFMDSADSAGQQSAGTDTEEILRQGEQMRMKREQEAIQWASEEAAKRMKDQIERATGQPVDRVVVRVDEAEDDAEPSISSIDVYMSPKEREQELSRKDDQKEASPGTSSRIAIAPVEPVSIEVNPQEREAVGAEDTAIAAASGESSGREGGTAGGIIGLAPESDSGYGHEGANPLSRQIADILSRGWGIPAEVVHVVLQEDAK